MLFLNMDWVRDLRNVDDRFWFTVPEALQLLEGPG